MNKTFIKIYKYLCLAIFCLVALGGAVRAMNAGLACPDWPLCFGDIIPDFHPQVYFEFLHRALAGVIGIVSVWMNIVIMRKPVFSATTRGLAFFAVLLLLAQVVMGGLTVLMQLHEKVVALHLGMGTGFFALSLWLYFTLKFSADKPILGEAKNAKVFTAVVLAAVYGQIILGGLVASHYAALVCTDFPLCHGEFIPTLNGIIGLHVIHRLGAYALTIIVGVYAFYIFKNIQSTELRKWTRVLVLLLVTQVGIGIANVLFHTPPLITVLHLANGAALLGTAVLLLRIATYVEAG